MGTNVIYLADLASAPSIPAYRRARLWATTPAHGASAAAAAPAPASWEAAARRRAAQRLGSTPSAHTGSAANGAASSASANVTSDHAPPLAQAGRLRLTGRLVDVCAELERLAQAEAVADAMARRA